MKRAADEFSDLRAGALAQMRSRWGRDRHLPATDEERRAELATTRAMPFLDLADDDLDLAARVPMPADMEELADQLRIIRAERFTVLQEPADRTNQAPSKRRELLEEIASEHFRSGMHSWLTGIAPDHGQSTTPLPELEQLREEMQYRLQVVRTIVSMMQREADALDSQIAAKRALERL